MGFLGIFLGDRFFNQAELVFICQVPSNCRCTTGVEFKSFGTEVTLDDSLLLVMLHVFPD